MADRRALQAAYLAATYRISTEPPIDLKIGRNSAAVAALLRWAGVSQAAIITAYNPGSERVDDATNAIADANLRLGLEQRGFATHDTVALDPAGQWPDEPGVLVLGIEVSDARVLGRAFGQHAVVTLDGDGGGALTWCRPG